MPRGGLINAIFTCGVDKTQPLGRWFSSGMHSWVSSRVAASEIKGLTDDSVDKVAAGSQQVADAGQTMVDIVASRGIFVNLLGKF